MKTAAFANLYESIRPAHTAEAGFVKIQRSQTRSTQCAPAVWPPVLPQVALRLTAILMLLAALLVLGGRAALGQESMQYSFGAISTDAKSPDSNLIFDSKGNLYGTSLSGGAHGYGTVFELSPGTGGVWTETVLYSFGGELAHDAGGPTDGLVFDTQGNLYGITSSGGVYGYGAAFELSPPAVAGGAWTEQVLHSFDFSTVEGSTPVGSLVIDASGNLYGAASAGGAHFGGAIFELSPGSGGTWTQTILYSFAASGDATAPDAGLVFDKSGNLFGTTYSGGVSNGGAVFELSPAAGGTWTEKVLHSFPINAATDGWQANNALIFDSVGNLYGTTHAGGHQFGTVFEMIPGAGGTWTEKLVYNFNPTDANPDGEYPLGNIVFDSKGNLYGATFGSEGGGFSGFGLIYKLTPQGDGTWTRLILHDFTGDYTPTNVAMDGTDPRGGVAMDASGNIYGTTDSGGVNAYGTFYVLGTESAVAAPVFSPAGGTYGSAQSITLTDSTPGSTIYYSNSGTPDTTSTIYNAPFAVSTSQNIVAFATAPGLVHSSYPLARYVITPVAATPVISPGTGTYSTPQTVIITDGTSGAAIYYTTNGTTPTTSSTKYTGAITVSASETIEAIAVASAHQSSAVAIAAYTFVAPTAATPVFSPAVGTYTTAQGVTISDATAGASIYYTTNGTTPSTSSTKYTGTITVSATETIEAIAVATGYTNSAIALGTYTIEPIAATPVFSVATGTYTSVQSVTITDATPGAAIYYTTNGSTPSTSSTAYSGTITISASEKIEAIAVAAGYTASGVAQSTYTIDLPNPLVNVLYNFNSEGECPGFGLPSAPIFDGKGNLFGTCTGITGGGEIYELTPSTGTSWTGTVIYNNGLNLGNPSNGLLFDSTKTNLFGVEGSSGANGEGSVYELSPAGGGTWTLTTLYSFQHGTDAQVPEGGLIWDAAGNLYGTTNIGGTNNSGTVYELSPTSGTAWTEKILYSFGASSTDGINPAYGLVFDAQGNLYGTTYGGGATGSHGIVFKLSPGAGGTWTESQIYTFAPNGGNDGAHPIGALIVDSAGNLYGTTSSGTGTSGQGIAYELSLVSGVWTEKILHSFALNGTDGADPGGGLTMDSAGNLYGVTRNGGVNGGGILYELSPNDTSWTETILFPFATAGDNIGYSPATSLTLDAKNNLYGATTAGGIQGGGSVYEFLAAPAAATPTFSPAPGTYPVPTSVTISDTTAGATIYYTADGSIPTITSTKYTAPILVSATETIEAIAVATGYSASAVASGTYNIPPPITATPAFSPAAGSYTSVQSVTISDPTTGATIYYTTNGTTPSTSSTKYTGAISVSSNETIEAIAVAAGHTNSAVASAAYTITLQAATPVFSVNAGTYTSTQSVTISDATTGATIYYTTNGTMPSTSSTKYIGAISVSSNETLEAIAVASGYSSSTVATAIYTITPPAAIPAFSPAAGTYTSVQSVTISDATAGATIYYTINGTTPTTSSAKYTGAISVGTTEAIEAIAIATGYSSSAVASAAYTINLPAAATPVFSPLAGTYTSVQSVAITDSTAGAAIYYTTDGSTPSASSTKYTAAISVGATETIKAIAIATGFSNSTVASAAYTINLPIAATPAFSPVAGTYTSVHSVTITDTTAGAAIYYTTDGTTPSAASAKYTSSISVGVTETIKAIAIATGFSNSAVASATYIINIPVAATPIFTPAAGTYTAAQSVTIADSTTGTTIYYTMDGSTPSASSTKYTAAISVGATETIKAIAIAAGYTNSAVASAAYTINIPVSATPIFSPAAGTYSSAQTVTVTDATAGATIYYTTDGSTPSASSTMYTTAISVGSTETIKAIAVAAGYTNSAVVSGIYTINIPVPTFTLSASPSSLTISPGQSATAMISVTSVAGFSGATTFGCSGLPTGATCSFAPATVTPAAGAPATTTLTVSAAATTAMLRQDARPAFPGRLPGGATLAVALCFFGLRKRRRLQMIVVFVAALIGTGLLVGCGGSSKPKTMTSTVTVTATSGAIQQTIPISITIE
jgi:uncharacterized repeat protein (TIGR03803 family)